MDDGTPRSVREFLTAVTERTVVTAHVHVSYDRVVDGVRLIGPGSVDRPYEGVPDARWAILGPDVDLRSTSYDIERAAELFRASGIPDVDVDLDALRDPTPRDEAVAHAESVVFAG